MPSDRAQVGEAVQAGPSAHVPLDQVANQEKEGAARIRHRGRLRHHGGLPPLSLEPLIAGEDYPPYKDGLPAYVKIKGVLVKKKLTTQFKL